MGSCRAEQSECSRSLDAIPHKPINTPPTAGERKHATVMFSDLSGYTAMTEKLDPEEVKDLMGRIFAEAGKIIEKYEGTVERFFGDEVMALFGVPVAHEDDPVRAVRAAMEIHAVVEKLGTELEPKLGRKLSMHTGINTGLVITGDERIGKGRHGLTGDAINLAKRLTGMGKAGDIVIGASTHRQTGGLFDFEKMPPVQVKGKADPVHVYRLIAKSGSGFGAGHRPRIGSERQIYSEMVGRDKELVTLEEQTKRLLDGSGGIINVIGEAGIGKSRLIAEFKQSDALEKVVVLEGRAISIGRNLSFHPVIDLLRNWARIGESDSPQIAFDKLIRSVRTVAAADADEIIPFVATMMGMKLSGKYEERVKGIEGEALERLILKNVRDLIALASNLFPLVIVMEDLHWADASSVALLMSLFRLAESRPILFIHVFRPGYEETDGDIRQHIAKDYPAIYHEMSLDPLDSATSEALIGNMLNIQGLPLGTKNRIVERAGGNPFFIEEVVRSFIDTGAIVNRGGRFEVTDRIDTVEVPYTVQDLLTARIDRLEDETRNLVKVASVIGRNFFRKILLEVAKSVSGIDHRLDYLKDIQLIRERKHLEEVEYLFKHALVQRAAYESILLQRRKEIHLLVASTIEQVFKERLHEFYGMLALHYSLSGSAQKTEEYLFKAGEEALRSSASSEALRYFQDGLNLYSNAYQGVLDPERVAMFEKNIAIAFFNKMQVQDAVDHIDRTFEYWGFKTQKNILLILIRFLWGAVRSIKKNRLLSQPGATQRQLAILELLYKKSVCLTLYNASASAVNAMVAYNYVRSIGAEATPEATRISLGTAGMWSVIGLSHRLSKVMFRQIDAVMDHSRVDLNSHYLSLVSVCAFISGDWCQIAPYDEKAIDAVLKKGIVWEVGVYLYAYGLSRIQKGVFGEVGRILEKLEEMESVYRSNSAKTTRLLLEGSLSATRADFESALPKAEAGIDHSERTGSVSNRIRFMGLKAESLAMSPDFQKSDFRDQMAAEALKSKRIGPPYLAGLQNAIFLMDLVALKNCSQQKEPVRYRGCRKTAWQSARGALKTAKRFAPYRVKVFRLTGEYFWAVHRPGKAFRWWSKAISEGERLGTRPDLARTYFEVSRRLLEPNSKRKRLNGITAEEYLEMARRLFEEMDLQWDLAELEKVLSANKV